MPLKLTGSAPRLRPASELEVIFLRHALPSACNNALGRNLSEPLLCIFILARKGFLFVAVGQIEATAQPRNIISLGACNGLCKQMTKISDHRWRNRNRC